MEFTNLGKVITTVRSAGDKPSNWTSLEKGHSTLKRCSCDIKRCLSIGNYSVDSVNSIEHTFLLLIKSPVLELKGPQRADSS